MFMIGNIYLTVGGNMNGMSRTVLSTQKPRAVQMWLRTLRYLFHNEALTTLLKIAAFPLQGP